MDEKLIELDRLLTEDLRVFSKVAPLSIKHKDPTLGIVPFKFNNAQEIIHEKLEEQLKTTGKVRAIILKGRQQGVSTYVGARFYHKTSRNKANNTFIMTHLAESTANLFSMTRRYHSYVDERLRTPTKTSSKTEMEFESLDSNYRVATAGSKESGRSFTITNFHASEYAFWPDPDRIKTGAMQAVPDAEGTEIIIESTANGMNNDFYTMCMNALSGQSSYQLIFIPWFIQEEYRAKVPIDTKWTKEELELKKTYSLDYEQLYWRRKKIDDFSGKVSKFMQEYPCNIKEAFQGTEETLIDIEKIMKARGRTVIDESPLVMGVDPAHRGDRAVISLRRGRKWITSIVFDTKKEPMGPMEFVDEIVEAIKEYRPAKVFIDKGENGHAIISRLHQLGYRDLVIGVDFGGRARRPDIYENKRAEMWCGLRDWIEQDEPQIPDKDEVQADLMSMPDYIITTSSKIRLWPKEKIKQELKMSPDIGDSIALTFAYPTDPLKNSELKVKGGLFNKSKDIKIKHKRKTVKL